MNKPAGARANLAAWLFLYALAYTGMHIVPVYLPQIKDGFTIGDALSVFATFVVVPVAWKVYLVLREHANWRHRADGTPPGYCFFWATVPIAVIRSLRS